MIADRTVFYYSGSSEANTLRWEVTNTSSTGNFRQVVIEFLDIAPKHSEAEVRQLLARATYSTAVGTELLLENDRCRVWDFSFGPGGGEPGDVHQHVLDYIFCFPCAGTAGLGKAQCRLLGYNPDGSVQFDSQATDGDFIWQPVPNGGFEQDGTTPSPAHRHGGKNGYDDKPFVEYLVELK